MRPDFWRANMVRLRVAVAVGMATACFISTGSAQTTTRTLENTGAFRVAFGMSVLHFYGCGDDALGGLFLRALQDKLDHCPFSDKARSDFHAWTAEQFVKFNELRQQYISVHGKMPDRLDGMQMTCEEERHSADYLKFQDQMTRYAHGQLTTGDIIKDRCDVPPEYP